MAAASSGETRSSASRQSTQSWRAALTANCFCGPKPSQAGDDPGAVALGQGLRTIRAAGVDNDDVIGKMCALQAFLQLVAALRVMIATESG